MNCGLSNLATLKSFVIPVALQDRPDFDADVRQIGVGVLGMLEAHCNRRFARTVGDTITVTADRSFFYLPRIPIEGAVEIALRVAGDADFATQDDLQSQLDPTTGGIEFLTVAATYRDRLRFTWTGGYWFQSAEAGESQDVRPEGATAVPDGLLTAWLLQCQEVYERHDHVVSATLPGGGEAMLKLADAQLLPVVKQMLQPFIRYQLL